MIDLMDKIEKRQSVVAVIGLGYVGLPLATAFGKAGLRVIGIDADPKKVDMINDGHSYIPDVPSEDIVNMLSATSDYAVLTDCDAIFICVPSPFDEHKTPDLSYIVSAAEGIARYLRPEQLVVLQSTTFPGTTEEVVRPILEGGGLKAGQDFYLAFSPERVDPGNAHWTVENMPKVVGGLTPCCTQIAVALLNKINPDVHPVSSPRTAEMSKLLENIFRHVNIALINELALLAELTELDIWEVIEAASTKPFGFMPFYPGPGVGGHCIPVDPTYLSWKARAYDFTTKFIDLAAEANQRMPYHTVELIARALEEQHKGLRGAKVLLLGAAFKPNIDDARNSPTERVMTLLLNRRVEVSYYDPYIPRFEIRPNAFYRGHEILESVALDDELLREQDCVVILVRHRGVDYARLVEQASLVVDAVNATAGLAGASEKVVRLGVGQRMSPPHLNALQFAPMSQVDEVS
jgi:UDP-N-acetyl-D-glucosamine dehydrogenase